MFIQLSHPGASGFSIFKWLEKNQKKNSILGGEDYMKLRLQCSQIKFYWNATMLSCSHIVYGCIFKAMAMLSNWDGLYGLQSPR